MKKTKLLGFDLDDLIKASLSGLFEGADEPKSNWTEKLRQASQEEKVDQEAIAEAKRREQEMEKELRDAENFAQGQQQQG